MSVVERDYEFKYSNELGFPLEMYIYTESRLIGPFGKSQALHFLIFLEWKLKLTS
jgi:hypothetical protein